MAKQGCDCPPPGAPMWLATFADLMSLLMCFFVLLLSFSEMDAAKFKQLAGSMKYAFGVQNQIEVRDIPKGTSVIALEFRPGKPDPAPIEVINQQTQEMTKEMLRFQEGEDENAGGKQEVEGEKRGGDANGTAQKQQDSEETAESKAENPQEQTDENLKKVAEQLEKHIEDGAVELESLGQQIIIRVKEKGSFAAGSGFLQPRFRPIIREIGKVLNDIPGVITVSGHTDDALISNELYRSNWELSSKRALSVAHELIAVEGFDSSRMKVVGMASSQLLVPNTSPRNRARNRRVEIAIEQGKPKIAPDIQLLDK